MISVIVPTCNRNDLLSICLNLLAPSVQTLKFAEYEVLVTDDSNNNSAKDLVQNKHPWAVWHEGPKNGPASNRNNGANFAKGDWLVFIDDDVMPDKQILAKYKEAILRFPEERAFEGMIVPDDWKLLKKDLSECPINLEGDCFWSANVCIKKDLFLQVNGFDTSYLLAAQEDQQIKIDIERATGKKIKFLPETFVIHPVRFTTIMKQIKRIPTASKNFTKYALRNKEVLNYQTTSRFVKQQFTFHLKRTLTFLWNGKFKSSFISLAWLLYGVPLNVINMSRMNEVSTKKQSFDV